MDLITKDETFTRLDAETVAAYQSIGKELTLLQMKRGKYVRHGTTGKSVVSVEGKMKQEDVLKYTACSGW